jgi:RNA polymerase sigma-70 factor (ECF subfamily)
MTAFDALIGVRRDRCYRRAWAILANDADAADATQDAFVAAWRELPRLRDAGAFDGWLDRIVANTSRMARRHRMRLREVPVAGDGSGADDGPTWESGSATIENECDAIVARDAMDRAFDRLRPADRALILMHHVDERSVAEIALQFDIPVGTAKWRLHQARKALERAMAAES